MVSSFFNKIRSSHRTKLSLIEQTNLNQYSDRFSYTHRKSILNEKSACITGTPPSHLALHVRNRLQKVVYKLLNKG